MISVQILFIIYIIPTLEVDLSYSFNTISYRDLAGSELLWLSECDCLIILCNVYKY